MERLDRFRQPVSITPIQLKLCWLVGVNHRWKYWTSPSELKRKEAIVNGRERRTTRARYLEKLITPPATE